ncbi:MAG: type 4a pilus biogenesis protein PilO [Candidatus Gracilibacteria bacterium]|nr:type 4a pilus biogenesis protein PilO [Candidatus Gracilibacteria bacterium]
MFDRNDENSEIKINSKSRLTPLIGVFLILVAVGLFVFFARPVGRQVGDLQANVALKTQELNEMKQKIADMDSAKQEYGLTSELQRMEMLRSIPVGLKQDGAIEDLVALAEENNVYFTSIGFGKGSTDKQKIGSLQVSAGFEGTYEDLIEFLRDLEQNKRMFKVNSISVQLIDTDVIGFKRAVFSLAMETFYQE